MPACSWPGHSLVVAITTSMGARNGILVRDRIAMERVREVDMVIFDKTGTLTRGEFGVVSIETACLIGMKNALWLWRRGRIGFGAYYSPRHRAER
jgi:P-type E1-E2 ATPase